MANPIQESHPNICRRKSAEKRRFSIGKWAQLLAVPFVLLGFFSGGCGPKYTYPADTVSASIEKICREEYGIDASARIVGKTLGALFYVEAMVDDNGQTPKDIHEKMGRVRGTVARVALSSDLEVDFCVVYMRDKKGNELAITQSMDDVKRANAEAIGIEESMNRTLFSQSRFVPGEDGTAAFVLKEVKLESFLAEQIVQRIRLFYTRDVKTDEPSQPFILADGNFIEADGQRTFRFSLLALKAENSRETILNVFRVVNDVLKGYRFTRFDKLEIQDYLNRQKLVISKDRVEDYWHKRLKDAEIIERFLVESSSIQEAFKLFGFNVPQDQSAPATTSTPV